MSFGTISKLLRKISIIDTDKCYEFVDKDGNRKSIQRILCLSRITEKDKGVSFSYFCSAGEFCFCEYCHAIMQLEEMKRGRN